MFKIKIHFLYYVTAFICVLNGFFKDFIILNAIILFHELGHILMALKLKWNIDKVIILPLGALTIFNEKINKPIIQEFLICISGPLFQILIFIINFLFINNQKIYNYNLFILLLNLIPILPLDGSKIINLILNKFFSFKFSHILSIYISIIMIIVLIFLNMFNFNLVIFITLIFNFIKTLKEFLNHNLVYKKFLFERYLYNFNFSKRKIIKNIYEIKRDYKHLFYINKNYKTEKEILSQMFDF